MMRSHWPMEENYLLGLFFTGDTTDDSEEKSKRECENCEYGFHLFMKKNFTGKYAFKPF